jgi:hypothetical protein
MMRRFPFAGVLAAVVLCSSASVRADELKLKDGTKIVGTIVGFEENSFRVKTNYGFAVVQKDQVLSISITDPAKKPDAEKKPAPAAEKPAPPAKSVNSYSSGTGAPASPASAAPVLGSVPASNSASASGAPAPALAPAKTAAPIAVAPPPAPKPAPPESMREVVNGNLYRNDTYGFHMYKPPTWELVEGARTVLPGAITALGTSDQTTYLLIGRQPVEKSFTADIDSTERHLRETLDNFRALGEKKIAISGAPAIERRFRVSVEQHDWSGIVVFFQHDTHLYTIFGMTAAESDLVQIQENVISRAISSIEFTKQ